MNNNPLKYSETTGEECQLNHRLEYKVRVRGSVYLWGSAGVTTNANYPQAPILHIRNDKFGEVISFGTQVDGGGIQTAIGALQPGESYSIPIQGITGVFATCASESTVYCVIR